MPVNQEKLIKLVTSRQAKLENDKANFNDRMQDVADYVCPHRDDIRGTLQKGSKKGTKIYDGTAVGAAVLAADGIHGYHVSPAFPWFKYQMNRKEVNKIPEVREWLDEIEFNMYQALTRSNFYSEMWSYIYDGETIGTAPVCVEEDIADRRLVFESVHPGEAFIAENKYGEVDLMHRLRKLTARQLIQMFGKNVVPDNIKQAYESQPFSEYEVIHAVFPREEFDDRLKDAKNKRFASVWYLKAGNVILKESGFDQFPYQVWRYMRSGKEPYGISPAMLAMADIKGVNLIDKCDLGARQMALDPPLNVPSYLEGKVQWRPRGFNYVKDPADKIAAAYTGSNFEATNDIMERKQRSIKERFHVDTFLMLANLNGKGQRTAYEVSEMMAEKAAVLGAELGPLNTELDHILDRVYQIEDEAGRMPAPPDILYELAEQDPHLRFDPVYMGPLAQAQRERFSKDGIRKFLTEIVPLAQMDQEVLDDYDFKEAGRIIADTNGVPASMIRSKEDAAAIRQARTEAIAQQNQMAAMQEAAQGMKTASEADKNMNGGLSQAVAQMMGGAGA